MTGTYQECGGRQDRDIEVIDDCHKKARHAAARYTRPVDVMALGYRTDLAVRVLEGSELTEYPDCVVVRSPANPGFRWGNFLLLRRWPRAGETLDWMERFRKEFPAADYVALGVDVPGMEGADAKAEAELRDAGFSSDVATVLTAAAVGRPRHPNLTADFRPLATDDDWRQANELAITCFPGGPAEREFMTLRTAARRQLAGSGRGAWFGAFLGDRLVAQLGVFTTAETGGVVRFQDVQTHPGARRQGLAGSLLFTAASYASDVLAATTQVIVADPAGEAIRLYRSMGFADQERQISLERVLPAVDAAAAWDGLDEPWREAFRQAWEAVRAGNIGVGACAATRDGEIVHASRNRVNDEDGPHGEIFGSSLAHAEMNVLARLGFRRYRDLVLTTTLQPCLQCSGAIRLSRIGSVRFAGHDVYWDGYHDFARLSDREARRPRPAERIGPRGDEIGVFGLLISRFRLGNPRLVGGFEQVLRSIGEGPVLDVAFALEDGGQLEGLLAMEVEHALAAVWPDLTRLARSV
jgi:tRNA(Arg) A34 adenosine deaminase TadA/GNAT superfamily N-acetyltransferase